jgi:ribosomal protein L11 methylase PrmA
LISNLLIDLSDRILARLRESGMLVVAGILRQEFEEVQRAYEKVGLELIKCEVQKEWRSGTFARR